MKKYGKLLLILVLLAAVVAGAAAAYSVLKNRVDAPSALNQMTESSSAAEGEDGGEQENPDKEGESSRQEAVDFTFRDAEGSEVKLSDFFGRPVVINFWATWCGYCKQEMPDFQEVYEEYGDRVNFIILNATGSQGETKEKGAAYLEEQGYTFPAYYDEEGRGSYTYSIYSLPTTILIDREGRVAAYNPGLVTKDALVPALEKLLAE